MTPGVVGRLKIPQTNLLGESEKKLSSGVSAEAKPWPQWWKIRLTAGAVGFLLCVRRVPCRI